MTQMLMHTRTMTQGGGGDTNAYAYSDYDAGGGGLVQHKLSFASHSRASEFSLSMLVSGE